jgi:hypothetical protein
VIVGHHIVDVYVWMSTIMLLLVFASFRNLPVRGGVLPIFFVYGFVFFFAEKVLFFLAIAGLLAPCRVTTAPTCHNPTSLTPPPP